MSLGSLFCAPFRSLSAAFWRSEQAQIEKDTAKYFDSEGSIEEEKRTERRGEPVVVEGGYWLAGLIGRVMDRWRTLWTREVGEQEGAVPRVKACGEKS